jgi:hypothetical protein
MRSVFSILFFLIVLQVNAQTKYTVKGYVRDSISGEAMIGVYIKVQGLSNGSITNPYGFYSITLPEGNYNIAYTYVGYTQQVLNLRLTSNLTQNLTLKPRSYNLNEVEVIAEAGNRNVTSTETGTQRLNIKEIKALPVLFGEQDVLKTIQLLPGVKSAGEGTSGFYVRGGTTDQNLVLLDDAPVYNTSHLLGFFSVFNSDAIKDVKLIKGGTPAEYGGRLSSVVDIRMNDGNSKDYVVSGGIGLISSRLTVEGPIVKDKGSFIISGRRTYADLFLKLSKDSNQKRTSLYFYDFNLKANYRFGNKDQVFLSGYYGRDVFNFANRFGMNWGNAITTLRWNHLFSERLFLNSSLIFSNYNYVISIDGFNHQFQIGSGIRDFGIKEDLQYYLNPNNTWRFGLNSTYHIFYPGSLTATNDTSINSRIFPQKTTLENGIYISNEQKLGTSYVLNYGLRISHQALIGPGNFYKYDSDGDIVDSTILKNHSIAKNYFGIEPRFAITYIFNQKNSIKASYTRIYQYIHLLSNTTSGNPTDLWLPTSFNIKPQYSDQVSLGFFKNFNNNNFETSVEVYYKTMQNLIDYKTGADIILNPNVESQLLYGTGWAYGSEFFLKKKEGKLTGWISYTLSRTLRQFDEINKGNSFPAKQDIIHEVALVGIYQASKRWTLGATWVYNTGNAVTFPSGLYSINNTLTPYYTERNGYRMPDYHRFDISATNTKKLKGYRERSWNISIYNVYGRKNAYSIDFQPDPNDPRKTQAVRTSLFRFVPSVTYNFKF